MEERRREKAGLINMERGRFSNIVKLLTDCYEGLQNKCSSNDLLRLTNAIFFVFLLSKNMGQLRQSSEGQVDK